MQTTLLEQLFFVVVGFRVLLESTALSTTELYPHLLLGESICKEMRKATVRKNME